MGDLYVALIHAPVYNKNREVVATSITNLDIHDIARCSATFGVKRYYIVHPAEAQQNLAKRIMGFWQEGFGKEYNPDRNEAFSRVSLVSSLEEAIENSKEEQGNNKLFTVATGAKLYPNTIEYSNLRKTLAES
ncbi:MAG: RNA methyltransferase, partial [Eubacteriales bacterium]